MANVETKTANEQMLDGMSNFITPDQWRTLLNDRINYAPGADNELLLSKEFILKYKNHMLLSSLPLYCMIAWDKKQLDKEFLKRFWNFIDFTEGNDLLLDFQEFSGSSKGFLDAYKEMCDMTDVALIHSGDVAPFTMEQLDKRPFHYNGEQWTASLNKMKEIKKEFLEKYIHMVDFLAVLNNPNLTNDQRKELRDYFGVKVPKGKNDNEHSKELYLFPCGAVLEGENWRDMSAGLAYLKNKNRFAIKEQDEAIKQVVAKWPRAFEDCLSGGNELVMVDK